jgi:cytochrome c oxidase subunit II
VEKGWSILFGVVFLGCLGSFVVAAFIPGWWLPKNIADFGGQVDSLFYIILGLTGFFFVLTEVVLIYTMWRFAYNPARKAEYTHGNHRLELVWTLVPAAILLYISFAQIGTWERIKYQASAPDPQVFAQVTARQWEWRIRQPSLDNMKELAPNSDNKKPKNSRDWAEFPEADDVYLVNELHTWKDANVKIYLKTQDVIHSFFLPNLRLKQDALPGKTIPVWFKATESNMVKKDGKWVHDESLPAGSPTFELACAELCGSRHYAMRGLLCVHPTPEDYKEWLEYTREQQKSYVPAPEDKPVDAKK